MLGYVFAIYNLLDSRMGTWLCCVIFCHYLLSHCLSLALHSLCSCTRCRGHDSCQGSGVSAGKTITSRPFHHWMLNTDNLGVKSKWRAVASYRFPDKSFFFSHLCKCLCIQYVHLLVCLDSVHLSLSELNGEKQLEWKPTLLILCLTCEIQHPLRGCDTSLPMGACLILIKLWSKLNLCQ